MQLRRWTGNQPACVSTTTLKVSLAAFTTLDVCAALSHRGCSFTPFKPNPSVPQQGEPGPSGARGGGGVKKRALTQETCRGLTISGALSPSVVVGGGGGGCSTLMLLRGGSWELTWDRSQESDSPGLCLHQRTWSDALVGSQAVSRFKM